MEYAATLSLSIAVVLMVCVITWIVLNGKKARRYAVTLKNNEGAFIGLCTRKRWDRWTFVDIKIVPTNPGGAVNQAAPGELYVPYRNILYYQEIANVAE